MSNDSKPEDVKKTVEQKGANTPSKVFLAVRQLPNKTAIRIEQSSSMNIRLTVSNGDASDSIVLSAGAAKALQAMLVGCLESR